MLQRIGAGGMGVVYLGVDAYFTVAVKTINPALNEEPAIVERFRREIDTLGKIDSDYVARLRNFEIDSDLKWMAVEHINSPDVRALVEERGRLSDEDFWAMARALLLGLADIHSAGVVHRDIKPENILFADKSLKIIDFGIAQEFDATSVTTAGVAGSPAWLSPEQIEGEYVSQASDVFSAGAVLHYAATGKNPWIRNQNGATGALFNNILQGEPDLDDLSDGKRALVSKMLSKEPTQRGTASSLLALLLTLQKTDAGAIKEAPRSKKKQRTKTAIAAGVIALFALAGLTVAFGGAARADFLCAETIYSEADHSQADSITLENLDFDNSVSAECQTSNKAELLFDVESCIYMDAKSVPFGVLKSREVQGNSSKNLSRKWNQQSDRYGCRTFVQLELLSYSMSESDTIAFNQRLSAPDSVSSEGSEAFVVSADGRGGSFVTRFKATNVDTEPHYLFVPEFEPVGIQLTWIDGKKPAWAATNSIDNSFKVNGINVVSQFCWSDTQLAEMDKSGREMHYETTRDGVRWTKVESSFKDVSCGDGLTQRLVTLPAKVISKQLKYGTCLPYALVIPETSKEPGSRMSFCVIAGHPKS